MKFPATNKVAQPLEEELGNSAKALEQKMSTTNWKILGRYYAVGFTVFLFSLFLLLVVIRLALHIF